jgi:DNA-binding XRE family transcriptional regulator
VEGGENVKYSLKELRARKNETQAAVAEALGISTQTYCAWEKDVSKVAIGKVVKVAEYFEVPLDEIKV